MSVIRKVKFSNIIVSNSAEITSRSGKSFIKASVSDSAVNSITVISGNPDGPGISSNGYGTFDLRFISSNSKKITLISDKGDAELVVKNSSGGGVKIIPNSNATDDIGFVFPDNIPSTSKLLSVDNSGNIYYSNLSSGGVFNSFSTISADGTNIEATGESNVLTLNPGSNISFDVDTTAKSITINSSGGAFNIFSTISADGSEIVATGNSNTLTLNPGSNISFDVDTTAKSITINSSASGGGESDFWEHIEFEVAGDQNQYRDSVTFHDNYNESGSQIRRVFLYNNQLRVELASFSPTVSASGQTNRYWDQPASQFSVSVTNPDDFTDRYISSVYRISGATGVHDTLSDYTTSGPSPAPDGGVDWSQTFSTNSTAEILSNGSGLSGGSASATIHFRENDDSEWSDSSPTINFSWQSATSSINFGNLSGRNFLGSYSSVSYSVSQSGVSGASAYSHAVTATGGTLSNSSGSGTMTFTNAIHKNNNSGRSVSLVTTFSRPASVTGTAYSTDNSSSDSSISASFTYPSFYIFTANTGSPPSREDIVDGYDFASSVTQIGNQSRTINQFITNSGGVPRAFYFAVRASATQPSSFKTGASASLLSDVSVTEGNSVNLEPDSPYSGYNSEEYTLYGITLQAGDTYVSIS